jgi:hypothetical protein
MEPEDTLDEAEELEEVETEGQATDSESSPDTAEEQEESTRPRFDEVQQKAFDKAIGEKVYQIKERDREVQSLQTRLKELESRIPVEQPPQVPETPDFYSLTDKEIQERLRQRDEAIAKRAQYDAQQAALLQQQQAQQAALQREQVARQNEKIKSYADRAEKLGVKKDDLQVAANKIAQFGLSPMLADHLLELDDGSLGTLYLGDNLLELDKLAQMPVNQALLYLNDQVMPNARKLKPKVNAAPEPLDTPHGSGSRPKAGGPKGATFE